MKPTRQSKRKDWTTAHTVFKLRLRQPGRQLAWLAGLLSGLLLGLALVGGAQVLLCRHQKPDIPVMKCIAPLWRRK